MTWLADTTVPRVTRGDQVAYLLRAELRQHWWLQPAVLGAGLAVWTLLLAVTDRVATAPSMANRAT